MKLAKRLLLLSLVYGLRPQRYLEIATFQGGLVLLACRAVDMTENAGNILSPTALPALS